MGDGTQIENLHEIFSHQFILRNFIANFLRISGKFVKCNLTFWLLTFINEMFIFLSTKELRTRIYYFCQELAKKINCFFQSLKNIRVCINVMQQRQELALFVKN